MKPDSEIDFSDIPQRIYPVYDPAAPLEQHTINLRLDAEVAKWLETADGSRIRRINFLLKRAVQRSKSLQPNEPAVLDKAS